MTNEAGRRQRVSILRLFCFIALVSILAPGRAYAYVDPATGSIVIQVLLLGFWAQYSPQNNGGGARPPPRGNSETV